MVSFRYYSKLNWFPKSSRKLNLNKPQGSPKNYIPKRVGAVYAKASGQKLRKN
jgi:hypothetical protein